MPTPEHKFSKSELWPPSPESSWMAANARNSVQAHYGIGLDLGALRVNEGFWEILLHNAKWHPFELEPKTFDLGDGTKVSYHWYLAAAFNRYGPGISYGPAHNQHDEARGYYKELNGAYPTKMQQLDLEHNKGAWQSLASKYKERMRELGKEVPDINIEDERKTAMDIKANPQQITTTAVEGSIEQFLVTKEFRIDIITPGRWSRTYEGFSDAQGFYINVTQPSNQGRGDGSLTVRVNYPQKIKAGEYKRTIKLNTPTSTLDIPVTLIVAKLSGEVTPKDEPKDDNSTPKNSLPPPELRAERLWNKIRPLIIEAFKGESS